MPEVNIEVLPGAWTVSAQVEAEVAALWERAPSSLSDGELFVVESAEVLKGRFVPYRYFWAKQQCPALPYLLKALSVSGVCLSGRRVLAGRRASHMSQYPGFWELVPSGGIEPRALKEGLIDYEQQLLWEFEEETLLDGSCIHSLHYLGLIEDGPALIDLACVLHLDIDVTLASSSLEYSDFTWLPAELAALPTDRLWVPTSKMLFSLI